MCPSDVSVVVKFLQSGLADRFEFICHQTFDVLESSQFNRSNQFNLTEHVRLQAPNGIRALYVQQALKVAPKIGEHTEIRTIDR